MPKHKALPQPATVIDMYLFDIALSLRDLVRLATPSVLGAPMSDEEGEGGADVTELREPVAAAVAQPEPEPEPPTREMARKAVTRDDLRGEAQGANEAAQPEPEPEAAPEPEPEPQPEEKPAPPRRSRSGG